MVASENKPVFSVDYVDDGGGYVGENKDRIDDYHSKALAKGYIPYAARVDRALDELNIIKGIQIREYNHEETSIISNLSLYLIIPSIAVLIIYIAYRKKH